MSNITNTLRLLKHYTTALQVEIDVDEDTMWKDITATLEKDLGVSLPELSWKDKLVIEIQEIGYEIRKAWWFIKGLWRL